MFTVGINLSKWAVEEDTAGLTQGAIQRKELFWREK